VGAENGGSSVPFDRQRALDLILSSATYRKAEDDLAFIKSPELRPLRLAMELMKAEMVQARRGIRGTVVVFGGTRIRERPEAVRRLAAAEARLAQDPGNAERQEDLAIARRGVELSRYYDEARAFGRLVTQAGQRNAVRDFVIVTGGGPGVMEAANRGACEAGGVSIGLNITLPEEQAPNPYITPDLCFQFHYFAIRKMHFLLRARAMVGFPGGFGTLDEIFETLTLVQTRSMEPIPIVLFGREYWDRVLDLRAFVREGVIDRRDLHLVEYAETAAEAWELIARFYEGSDLAAEWCPIHKPQNP
jgi:uncharacterized protein (TIGR00730 family)